MLFQVLEGGFGMGVIKYKPPLDSEGIYIIKTKRNAAILNKGIAAFLRSTAFDVSSVNTFCTYKIYHIALCHFWNASVFKKMKDKPLSCPVLHIPQGWLCYIAKYP